MRFKIRAYGPDKVNVQEAQSLARSLAARVAMLPPSLLTHMCQAVEEKIETRDWEPPTCVYLSVHKLVGM